MIRSLINFIDARFPLLNTWHKYVKDYYVPKNLNIYYCFGALAVVVLLNQLFTGLWLTMFYTPTPKSAFDSIEYLMREVNYGWMIRYMHSTGASAFFIVLYLHLFRGLLYGSYQKPRELVWILGMLLFFIVNLEAFLGYLLPWGQMSYWGAEVITSLFGVVPYFKDSLVTWVRGDYSVGLTTLQRFFALHVTAIPWFLVLFVVLHIVAIHHVGSNNPEGIDIYRTLDKNGKPLDGIPFSPYYLLKDFIAIVVFLLIFFSVVFYLPDFGGLFLEPLNFLKANPLETPEYITPVWYMTPFYAMLRAIPDRLCGTLIMLAATCILFFLPWLDKSSVRSMRYKGIYSRLALAMATISFVLLGILGRYPVTLSNLILSRICIVLYFTYFLLMPIYTRMEIVKKLPLRIYK